MTIYNIPAIVKTALPLSTTPVNITKGFEVSRICPFNRISLRIWILVHVMSLTDPNHSQRIMQWEWQWKLKLMSVLIGELTEYS